MKTPLNTIVTLLQNEDLNYKSIAPHVRHLIEPYRVLLEAQFTNSHAVNYSDKSRDFHLEENQSYAIHTLKYIISVLHMIEGSRPVAVNKLHISSRGRELSYCEEHAVHHCAIIRFILRENGQEELIEEDFGVAKDTIRYRDTCSA